MAAVTVSFEMGVNAALRLTEVEMRALDALVGYGDQAFIDAFKASLGEAYMRNNEAGLRSFFDAVRRDVLPPLRLINQARKDLQAADKARLDAARKKETT